MNATFGVFVSELGAIDEGNLRRMQSSLAHRGGDYSGLLVDGRIGLGSHQKWILPEDVGEKQPISAGEVTYLGSARLDNRGELIERHGLSPAISEGSLILEVYHRYGKEFIHHLVGDFAVALWDRREQVLVCARDHFGVRPFYYWHDGRSFIFGSEIKAIQAYLGHSLTKNEVRLFEYISGLTRHDREITIFEGVRRLPPGHLAEISPRGITVSQYYELAVKATSEVGDPFEVAQELADKLRRSVRRRMRTSGRAGSELSGGLDSTFVTCLARDMRPIDKWPTVSNVFDVSTTCDERTYIDSVVAEGGIESHRVVSDDAGPLTYVDDVLEVLDDPYAAGNHHMVWDCYRTASSNGISVLLDGFDGDMVVGHGFERLSRLALADQWRTLWDEALAVRENAMTDSHHDPFQGVLDPRSVVKRYAGEAITHHLESGQRWKYVRTVRELERQFGIRAWSVHRSNWRRVLSRGSTLVEKRLKAMPEPGFLGLVNPDFLNRPDIRERLAFHREMRDARSLTPTIDREDQRITLSSDVFARGMEVCDHYASRWGLEIRHPYMDKEFVEFCLSLPADLSFQKGWSRYVMRLAMEGIVPSGIQWRGGKASMAPAFDRGLFEVDQKRASAWMQDTVSAEPYINVEALASWYNKGRQLGGREIWQVAMTMVLLRWLQTRGF